jgi:hypothetical protein
MKSLLRVLDQFRDRLISLPEFSGIFKGDHINITELDVANGETEFDDLSRVICSDCARHTASSAGSTHECRSLSGDPLRWMTRAIIRDCRSIAGTSSSALSPGSTANL